MISDIIDKSPLIFYIFLGKTLGVFEKTSQKSNSSTRCYKLNV